MQRTLIIITKIFFVALLLCYAYQSNSQIIILEYEHYNQSEQKFELKTDQFLKDGFITLSPDFPIFTLKLAQADSQDSEDLLYSFRIAGFQEEWQESKSNLIRMSGLPYGNHLMEIKGRLADEPASDQVLEIPIRVLRPFYFQWWFILLSISFIAISTVVFYLRRERILLERQRLLEATVEERTTKIREDKALIEQQAEELRSLDKMKSRFFANISHELRTPLTLILAPIDTTLAGEELSEKVRRNLLLVKKNGERLQRLVNEILDLTKLEANKLELKTSTVPFHFYLKTITNQFDSVALSREVNFIFDYELDKNVHVEIDKEKFDIVLYNLLSNAFKFTPEGGEVRLLVKADESLLRLEVSDTGSGIPDYDLPNIFNRFYQTKKPNAAAEGGTGIGLALTKEIVELMKGEIKVKSQLNEGTTFSLLLPKKEIVSDTIVETPVQLDEEKSIEPELLVLPAKGSGNGEAKDTVLLVEDNDQLRDFLTSLLAENFSVIQAENGQIALDKLEEFQKKGSLPHLIITDIMMPVMDGYQLIENIKASPVLTQVPVLVLTARASLREKLRALRIGIDDYLTKPFVQEELFARIHNLLRNAQNRQFAYSNVGDAAALVGENGESVTTEATESSVDKEWLKDLEENILKNIDNPDYTVERLADDMAISKRQLSRQIKERVGTTPANYLKTIRFARALELLENRDYSSVKAVAFSVGFKDLSNFSKQFKKRYGKSPSDYLN